MEIKTATKIADYFNISRSYIYKLLNEELIFIQKNLKGQYIWDDDAVKTIKNYFDENNIPYSINIKEPLKISTINNRRYLGNKYKLVPFIQKIVNENCKNINTVCDIFSGTGAVASGFLDKKIITNDLLYSNYIANYAWFAPDEYSEEKVSSIIRDFNSIETSEDNYMRKNFADTYFSADDCSKIGVIREKIEEYREDGYINFKEYSILITSLLYAMDKIANTVGHYDAYRRNASFDKKLELSMLTREKLNDNNKVFNLDANDLIKEIEVDLLYLDPPYNSRQYSDAYHLIENVACWEKPKVYGVARKMDRSYIKSDYCTQKATDRFEDLIENANARYILLSYNNMAEKGNDRSNAKISDEDIIRILSKKGTVQVFSESYKSFTTGKSSIKNNEERLFLCTCFEKEKDLIASPLNYIGGKYKLLPQILPLFPKNIDTFIDLFAGGGNVGLNVDTSKVIFNDKNEALINMFSTFNSMEKKDIINKVYHIINKYDLSLTKKNGYEYYGCNSKEGLSKYNKERYLNLRKDFNNKKNRDYEYYIMLYVLIVYSFNNQIRFNKKGEFNLPVGKRDFNSSMEKKLIRFINRIHSSNYIFLNKDFSKIDILSLSKDDFVYADPPYLITLAGYNENNEWSEVDELNLLNYLDELNKNDIKFALSNVLTSKGKENIILIDWIKKNDYYVHHLNHNYSNSNYQRKKRELPSDEVLIFNYDLKKERL